MDRMLRSGFRKVGQRPLKANRSPMSWKPILLTGIDNHYLVAGSYCAKVVTTNERMREKDRRLRAALAIADPWHMDLTEHALVRRCAIDFSTLILRMGPA